MSRRSIGRVLSLFALFMLFVSIPAQGAPAKDTMSLQNPASLGGKTLKPGEYVVSADDTKVSLSQKGKVVAEAPVQWKDESPKANFSSFETSDDKITAIHFKGQTKYVTVTP